MAVEFVFEEGKILVKDLISIQALDRGFFGVYPQEKKVLMELTPQEALYLLDVRGASCFQNGHKMGFNELAEKFEDKKFLAKYFCFKDWRDRGIIARPVKEASGNYGRSPVEKYPSMDFAAPKVGAKGLFFFDDLLSVIDEEKTGLELYERDWFGQWGTYKAKKHGRNLKLDAYETLFLSKHGGYRLANSTAVKLAKEAVARRSDFTSLYEVYEDLRLRGFILKTGFKFGTHFRLYFPGAKPKSDDEGKQGAQSDWMHSKHVIQVFPRESKMLISEWARAIRVAHGVKKTFILAIAGKKREKRGELDFLLYHRNHGQIENPKADKPKFFMLALSEEEEIGGEELAQAIEKSREHGLDLILSICDRETAVTHYRVKRIELKKSKFEYYEIEWMQP